MKRGLAYEFPLGPIYQDSVRRSIRKNLNKILGLPANRITKGNFDTRIKEALFNIINKTFVPILHESSPGYMRGFKIRSGDLLNSFGFAIYHNGKYKSDFVKTVKEEWAAESEYPSSNHTKFGTPQNALRRFAREYDCINKHGFTVVFMVGYPYSVDLEKGKTPSAKIYMVLQDMASYLAKELQLVKPSTVHYMPTYRIIL